MPTFTDNFIVTGTAGTGKSALVDELQKRGHRVFEEAQRAILTEQLAIDGPALPAKSPTKFISALLEHCISDLTLASKDERLSFFDRGIPDVAAYAIRFGVDPSAAFGLSELKFYNHYVFVLPPWEEIFANDDLRGKTFEEYGEFHRLIVDCYAKAGFNLIDVPLCSVHDRADFILKSISELTN